MLYRLSLKNGSEIYIYLLFEHKSYYDPKIFIQLLEMVKYLLSTRKDAEKYKDKNFYQLLEAEYMTVLDEILAEGELRGIEKGRAEGVEKGRAEGEERGKLETAKNMKAEGIELSVILKVTGLSADQLKTAGIL